MVPEAHKAFVDDTLRKLGVPPLPEGEGRDGVLGWLHSIARSHVEISLAHRPVLIANALGSPPVDVIEQAHAAGVKVAALAGAAKHAMSHVANGVDIIVAQGYEAGGHTGEIASMGVPLGVDLGITSIGIRYSNIDPLQEINVGAPFTVVSSRPSMNQCCCGTWPSAMATKLARRASEASRS